MSFRELSAWVCLGGIFMVYVPYFVCIRVLFEQSRYRGGILTGQSLGMLVLAVVVQILLTAVALGVISIRRPPERKDERDAVIEARSFRYAYGVLISLIFVLMTLLPYHAVIDARGHGGHVLYFAFLNQMLLLAFVVAEFTKYLVRAVSYRHGR